MGIWSSALYSFLNFRSDFVLDFLPPINALHLHFARSTAVLRVSNNLDSLTPILHPRVAARSGERASRSAIANLARRDAGPKDIDHAEVLHWFLGDARSGDPAAALNIGLSLASGFGVEQNTEMAARWIRHAAERLPEAQYVYARMLLNGDGVEASPSHARAYLQRAADSGHPDAPVVLADLLMKGIGGELDQRAGARLLEEAAKGGHTGAMVALASLLSQLDDPAAAPLARRYLQIAAERGHERARDLLARFDEIRGAETGTG